MLLFSGVTFAQSMKPGLWEYQSTVKSQSGEMEAGMKEMQRELASMPPEQRREMEKMMSQSGLQFGGTRGDAQVMRICITPEQAADLDLKGDDDCKQEIVQRSGQTLKIRFSCGGDLPSKGEGTFSFRGDTSFSGQFWFEAQDDEKKDRIEMTQQGKWISASCEGLKKMK